MFAQSLCSSPPSRPAIILRWFSIFCLFLVVHLTHNRLEEGLALILARSPEGFLAARGEVLLSYAASMKYVIFFLSLVVLTYAPSREILQKARASSLQKSLSTLGVSIAVTVILGVLVLYLGNFSMGEGYALRSISPFEQSSDWYHKRLLMPVLAHLLFFKGGWLFFGFGFLITIVFVAILQVWLRSQAPIPFWQLVSLCTSSFVIFQFQSPGYPDTLAFCFLLGLLFPRLSSQTKFVLLVLALLSHEASLFVGIPLAWRYLDKRDQINYVGALSLYGLLWLGCSRFQIDAVLTSHDVEGLSGLLWVVRNPLAEVVGVFFAFKVLWVLPGIAVLSSFARRDNRNAIFIILCIGGAMILTTVGVDTSRLAGFAFPAVLVSLGVIKSFRGAARDERMLSALFLVNLLIPSVVVGLNTWISAKPGVYGEIWRLLSLP